VVQVSVTYVLLEPVPEIFIGQKLLADDIFLSPNATGITRKEENDAW
jgi:hypothetical protein